MTLDSSFSQKINRPQPRLSFSGILQIVFGMIFFSMLSFNMLPFNMLPFNTTANAASLNSVNIKSNLDPNAITITEIDVVFLYDQALIEDFPTSKSSWYSKRRTLTQAWGDSMDVVSVFVPQGFDFNTAALPERKLDAVKVYVFGQHDEAAAIPVDVTDLSAILVTIDDLGIIVTSHE